MSENNFICENIKELDKINEKFKKNIKLLYVFHNNVVLFTNEDKVYCSGGHSYSVLEFDTENLFEVFTSNRQIIDKCRGQLGINYGMYEKYESKRIQIEVAIKKISCGHEHNLLLCNKGKIYVFGWDDSEQQELSNCRDNLLDSIKLNHYEKIKEIVSHYQTVSSVTVKDFNYVWSKFGRDGIIKEKNKTKLESFEGIFSEFLEINLEALRLSSHMIHYFIPNGKFTNNWKQIKKIDEGSYGKVFEVKHKIIEKKISAVKIIEVKEEDSNMKEDSINELVVSSLILKFNSDHLVRYYDVWYENDFKFKSGFRVYTKKYTIYIEMDLCDKTLQKIKEEIIEYPKLYSNNSLTLLGYYIISEMFTEIFEGVKYLHNENIIHRDLNPYNILIKMQKNGNCIKIADFNLAVVHEAGKKHSMDRGHVNYAAPEQQNRRDYDTKVDIHNLGVTLKQMFDIHSKGSTNDSSNVELKYEYLKKLFKRMTKEDPKNRPNCEQILEERNKWTIDEREFDFRKELNFHSGISNVNRSYVQTLIVSKLSKL